MTNISRLLDEHHQKLFYLQDRWKDEKEYEDFAEYQEVVSKIFKEYGFTDIKLLKSFVIKCKENGHPITVKLFKSGKIEITE